MAQIIWNVKDDWPFDLSEKLGAMSSSLNNLVVLQTRSVERLDSLESKAQAQHEDLKAAESKLADLESLWRAIRTWLLTLAGGIMLAIVLAALNFVHRLALQDMIERILPKLPYTGGS